jgi:hypothetical protein
MPHLAGAGLSIHLGSGIAARPVVAALASAPPMLLASVAPLLIILLADFISFLRLLPLPL